MKNSSVHINDNIIATTWKDGPYLLVVKIVSSKQDANWNLTGEEPLYYVTGLCYPLIRMWLMNEKHFCSKIEKSNCKTCPNR